MHNLLKDVRRRKEQGGASHPETGYLKSINVVIGEWSARNGFMVGLLPAMGNNRAKEITTGNERDRRFVPVC